MRKQKPLKPRIALVDIETAPILGYAWQLYETNILKPVRNWYLLSFAVKFLGEKDIDCLALPDFSNWKKDRTDDKQLTQRLHGYFEEADVIVAHNGDEFDIKKANARFLTHGLKPPSPYKTIDTLKIARKHFRFDSNKLSDLAGYLDIGSKVSTGGFSLWEQCMAGDKKAWARMKEYNVHDVELLEAVYLKLRPWAEGHPNLAAYTGDTACPTCQSGKVQRRGTSVARTQVRQRFHCQSCGAWFTGKIEKVST